MKDDVSKYVSHQTTIRDFSRLFLTPQNPVKLVKPHEFQLQ